MSNSFLEAFTFLSDQHSFVIGRLISHLEISGIAVGIAVAIGAPIGIFLGHIHRFSFLAINVSNIGRALPSLGILAIFLPIVGVGESDVIIALVILAAPPILTNAYVAIDQVDADTVDAAKGTGLRPLQVLTKVEIPLALPLIFAGVRTAAVFVIATATLSGFFGGGGLGDIISNEASYKIEGVIGACYVLIALAFVAQAAFVLLERLVTPAGLKLGTRTPRTGRRGQPVLAGLTTDKFDEDEPTDDAPLERELEKGRTT